METWQKRTRLISSCLEDFELAVANKHVRIESFSDYEVMVRLNEYLQERRMPTLEEFQEGYARLQEQAEHCEKHPELTGVVRD